MTVPTDTLHDSGKLKRPLVSEEEKDHVREGNLSVSVLSGTLWSLTTVSVVHQGRSEFWRHSQDRAGCQSFPGFASQDLIIMSNLIHTDPDGFFSKKKSLE